MKKQSSQAIPADSHVTIYGTNFLVALLLGFMALSVGCQTTSTVTTSVDRPAANPSDVIRFITKHNLLLVRGEINDQPAGFFLLDTGSSVTVIHEEIAKRHALPYVGRGRIVGIGGSKMVGYVKLETLTADQHRFGQHAAAAMDLSQVRKSIGWPISGIIGINALKHEAFLVDYSKRTIQFLPDDYDPPDHPSTRLLTVSRLPALEAKVGSGADAVTVLLQVDTGSNASLSLPVELVQDHPQHFRKTGNFESSSIGVGGEARTIRAQVNLLQIGDAHFSQQDASIEYVSPTLPFRGIPVGRIGNPLLMEGKILLDFPNHRAWIIQD